MPKNEEEDQRPKTSKAFASFLRRHPTRAERLLWQHLRKTRPGYKFTRQFRFDEHTFCDFCCTSVRVIVELDGDAHFGQEDKDASREKRLTDAGFQVLRFRNEEVFDDPDRVVDVIINACSGRTRRRY